MPRIPVFMAVAFFVATASTAQVRYLSASLDGSQEVPAVATGAKGWALITANDATRTIDVFLQASGLTGTAAHVHVAAVGVNGPVIVPLAGGPTRYTTTGATLSVANYTALTSGGCYVNVHTSANPGGEIRGQVVAPTSGLFTAVLNGAQETPPNASTGSGSAVAHLHEPDNVLTYKVTSSGTATVTAAHIHSGATGVAGPVLFPLLGSAGQYCGYAKLSTAQVATLKAGGLYFNIHSTSFPGGEIRGQIDAAGGVAALTTSLSGANETPPVTTSATGNACMTLNPDHSLTYVVTTQGLSGTAAHIHRGAVGVAGPVLIPLTGGPTVWSGTTGVLTATQIADATGGLWYVNVHTVANPGGEIRGQLAVASLPSTFGAGCPGTNGQVAEIGALGVPCPGTAVTLTIHGATPTRSGTFLLGTSVFPAPVDLAVLNMSGCFLFHGDVGVPLPFATDATGCATLTFPIPAGPGLTGFTFYNTGAILDPGATVLGFVMSNALSSTIQ